MEKCIKSDSIMKSGEMICIEGSEYAVVGDAHVILYAIYSDCDDFTVKSEVISQDGTKYKVIGISKNVGFSLSNTIRCISFDESSEIVELPTSFIIYCCYSVFTFPPKIKHIRSDHNSNFQGPRYVIDKDNKFITTTRGRILMNNFPLELLRNNISNKRLFIRETTRIISHGAFISNKNIKHVTIPASVEEISDKAFYGCTSLAFVSFRGNSKLKNINEYAFNSTAISHFHFPLMVVEIGEFAFNGCKNLLSLSFQVTKDFVKTISFPNPDWDILSRAFSRKQVYDLVMEHQDQSKLIKIATNAFPKTK